VTAGPTIWQVLGLTATSDMARIRRAYASRLRATRPEDDPEGFRRLRVAYEAALKLAAPPQDVSGEARVQLEREAAERDRRSGEAGTDGSGPDAVQGHDEAPIWPGPDSDGSGEPPVSPAVRAVWRAAFSALSLALEGDSSGRERGLQRLLDKVLDLTARGDVLMQSEAEGALAQLLASTSPSSDPLLEACVRRFGWDTRESDLTQDQVVRAVLSRWRDLGMLSKLRSGSDANAAAFARLGRRQNPLLHWWRANVTQLHRWPELQLLDRLRDHHPALLGELDATQVAWWERFRGRPKPSYAVLKVGGVLLLLGCFGALVEALGGERSWRDAASAVLFTLVSLVLLLLLKLYLIDWPVVLVKRRWPAGPPLLIQAGWLPMLITTLGIIALSGQGTAISRVVAPGAIGCLWATYVSGPMPPIVRLADIVPAKSRIVEAIAQNVVLACWWLLALRELPPRSGDANLCGALFLMSAVGFGVRALDEAWSSRLSPKQRSMLTIALVACAPVLAVLTALDAGGVAFRPVRAWLITTFIVLHRIPCLHFGREQLKARAKILLVCVAVALLLVAIVRIDLAAPIMQVGGLVLLTAALGNLGMALHNQKQGL
jgi:hypothetical protein